MSLVTMKLSVAETSGARTTPHPANSEDLPGLCLERAVVDLHARTHGRREADFLDVAPLGGGWLNSDDFVDYGI